MNQTDGVYMDPKSAKNPTQWVCMDQVLTLELDVVSLRKLEPSQKLDSTCVKDFLQGLDHRVR
jgi:predicted RNA-binding protein with PUA-like domain